MQKTAIFPGTFDPITLGHTNIIMRALRLFDKVYVGIGIHSFKKPMFSACQRQKWIREVFTDEPKVEALIYDGLTIDFCKQIGAKFIIRGIRYMNDFEYEKSIADTNYLLDNSIETLILTCQAEYNFITSNIVRDIISHNGDISKLVPTAVSNALQK